ncbi:hypothetical protein [Marinomonas sp. 2405UD68-3]|uniref:hypothetical protein n=1 Tax=Marinomonas sp. 2405UD68-3 TaxID=3391835 RepID=UPI0039C960F1
MNCRKAVFIATLISSGVVQADFILVKPKTAESLPTKHYSEPVAAFIATDNTVKNIKALKLPVSEIGNASRSLESKSVTPNMQIFSRRVGDVISLLIPSNFELAIFNGTDMDQRIAVDINEGTPWIEALGVVMEKSGLASLVNWSNSSVTISSNSRKPLESNQDKSITVSDGNETYVIRKSSDDIKQIKNGGFLIKDGKAIRFETKQNSEKL